MKIFLFKKKWIALLIMLLGFTLIYSISSYACRWDSTANKCHPDSCEVVVYKDSGCKGPNYYCFDGQNQNEWPRISTKNWPDGTNLGDSISCYVIGYKTKFYYYEHVNFGGKSVKRENGYTDRLIQQDLGGTWWNDKISSVRVFCK
ncbi:MULTISPECIES: hypothetical protein [Thermodesulfovibrio]|uniref:hypothetical protein n=1 Tax=Thermodesulfovibrio TaxID=28261 RepID=UPI00263466A3|nr:hypothetical protein [Thermodesulfovibrio sp.]